MNDEDFKEMLSDLIKQEEILLQVNSEEFIRKHSELLKLIEEGGRKR